MDSRLSFRSNFLVLAFIIFLVSVEVPVSFCSYDWYSSCSNRFNCGNITDVGYPFRGDGRLDGCGHPDLKLNCVKNITTTEIMKVTYRVLAANTSTKILKIVREDYLVGGICSPAFADTTLDSELFDYGVGYGSITLFYGCPSTNFPPVFSCNIGGIANNSGYIAGEAEGPGSACAIKVVVPVRTTHYKDTGNWSIMEDAIKEGFDVKWKEDTAACSACTGSKGVCGYDPSTKQTTCYSPAAGASQTPSSKSDNEKYLNCSAPFDCAGMKDLNYPFWGSNRPKYCGHPAFKLNCSDDAPHIKIEFMNYRILDINKVSRTLMVAREDYWNTVCPARYYMFRNYTSDDFMFINLIDFTFFDYDSATTNLTLYYACSGSFPYQPHTTWFNCSSSNISYGYGFGYGNDNYCLNSTIANLIGNSLDEKCRFKVIVPVLQSAAQTGSNLTEAALVEAIDGGFMLRWDADSSLCDGCQATGGQCGYNTSTSEFTCFVSTTEQSRKRKWRHITTIGISTAMFGIVVMIAFVIIYSIKRSGRFSSNSIVWWKRNAKNDYFNTEEIIKSYGLIAPKRYTYSNLKKLTNSFEEKVGQGGYGVVYKGKLNDGSMVAVKILSTSKGNGEEFINEVASISRTSHVNIVTLLGFCYERTKRALIYEFMPNGSLDKFIYDKGSPITNHHLNSKTMFQIAVGIARGLEYLHRGCNTRILHFDIKPHNILLDEDLHPKISDFGLAKLCKTKESIVSMTGMRGTAGYIAPEVFNRYFGGVSHKSDVYSYGMLVLEMVGARKEFDRELSQTSETYFPHGIYSKLEQGESFVTLGNITEEEEDTIKKMVMVSLWCTQTSPSDRPSMGKVIEMLEGSLQSLQFPPKPVMHSPVRSPQDSSTTSQSQNPTF